MNDNIRDILIAYKLWSKDMGSQDNITDMMYDFVDGVLTRSDLFMLIKFVEDYFEDDEKLNIKPEDLKTTLSEEAKKLL